MTRNDDTGGTSATPIRVPAKLWRLDADPAKLTEAANMWRYLDKDTTDIGEALNGSASKVYNAGWQGATRTSYEPHQKSLSLSMIAAGSHAADAASIMDAVAYVVNSSGVRLFEGFGRITAAVPSSAGDDIVTFLPTDDDQKAKVFAAVAEARTIRSDLDAALAEHAASLGRTAEAWTGLTNGIPRLAAVPEGKAGTLQLADGIVVVYSGAGDDKVEVRTDGDGHTVVMVNGRENSFLPNERVFVRGGQGNDTISVKAKGDLPVTVLGGDGADKVTVDGNGTGHTVITGDGNDTVDASDGDHTISTGSGNDVVNTKGGNDTVYTGYDRDTVNAKDGDNTVSTSTGDDRVTTGGGTDRIYTGPTENDPAYPGKHWDEVHSGGGDDTIVGGSGSQEIYGGDGNDTVYGGDGEDYADGQNGDDKLYGGQANDTLYGLNGNDEMYGGDGKDYGEGGQGVDAISGGGGDDALSGGGGDDRLYGDGGDDVLYGGQGRDAAIGGDGDNTAYTQPDDNVADARSVRVDISPNNHAYDVKGGDDFKTRVQADLDMMAASPRGQQMLDEMAHTHTDPRIEELKNDHNGYALPRDKPLIRYNPAFRLDSESTPSSVLFHEMAHTYDFTHNNVDETLYVDRDHPDSIYHDDTDNHRDDGYYTATPTIERQAAGLPIDVDHNPDTAPRIDPDHRIELTENGMRQEQGRDARLVYGSAHQPTRG